MGFGTGIMRLLRPLGPVAALYGFFVSAIVAAVIGSVVMVLGRDNHSFGPYLAVAVPITTLLLLHQRLFAWYPCGGTGLKLARLGYFFPSLLASSRR